MNYFKLASQKERALMRQLFKKHNITDFDFTDDDGYDGHDGQYTNSKNETIQFEVKNRNELSYKYPTSCIDIEKYNYLITLPNPYLFIFFADGKYHWHKLSKNINDYNTLTVLAPNTTMGNNIKVYKKIVQIPISSLQNYDKIN